MCGRTTRGGRSCSSGRTTLKRRFDAAGLPRIPSASHIVPLHVGDAALCTEVSRRLLTEFGMYATPINYPTVPRGDGAAALHPVAAPYGCDDGSIWWMRWG